MKCYVGIENEFQLYDADGHLASASAVWEEFCKRYPRKGWRSGYSLWTTSGTRVYADDKEPEVCTPPVQVRKGFVRELVETLKIARKELSDMLRDGDRLIGYSIHYNLSNTTDDTTTRHYEALRAFAIPFSLFTINPLSIGIALRDKPGRHEFLADHVQDEEQIGAFALLYAGMMLNYEKHARQLPFRIRGVRETEEDDTDFYTRNRVKKGRDTMLKVRKRDMVSAQEYLEQYYRIFKDDIAEIGTQSDIALLEDFISGKKELDIDRKEFYARMKKFKQTGGGFEISDALCAPRSGEMTCAPVGEFARVLGYYLSNQQMGDYALLDCGWSYATYKHAWLGYGNPGRYIEIRGFDQMQLASYILEATHKGTGSIALLSQPDIPEILSNMIDRVNDERAERCGLAEGSRLTPSGEAIVDAYRKFLEVSA
jgi:hypothetical protein